MDPNKKRKHLPKRGSDGEVHIYEFDDASAAAAPQPLVTSEYSDSPPISSNPTGSLRFPQRKATRGGYTAIPGEVPSSDSDEYDAREYDGDSDSPSPSLESPELPMRRHQSGSITLTDADLEDPKGTPTRRRRSSSLLQPDLRLASTTDYIEISGRQAPTTASPNTSYHHYTRLPALCVRLLGLEVILNLKRYEEKVSIRELFLIKLWDIEMFGISHITKAESTVRSFSCFGLRITRTRDIPTRSIRWGLSPNHKMAAAMLMVSLSCLFIYTESHQPFSALLALMLSPLAVLSFTEILLSYRFITALVEVLSGFVNGITGMRNQNLSWDEFLCYFTHYRILFFALSLPSVFLEFHPLAFLLAASIAIEYIDAYFSHYGMLVLKWDCFNICAIFLGYSNINYEPLLDRFTLFSINVPLTSGPDSAVVSRSISSYFKNITQPNGLKTSWAEEVENFVTIIR